MKRTYWVLFYPFRKEARWNSKWQHSANDNKYFYFTFELESTNHTILIIPGSLWQFDC